MADATVLKRLKMSLGNKQYFPDDELELILEDNDLYADDIYDIKTMEKQLLLSTLAVLESALRNSDIMKKIEAEFVTIGDGAKYMRIEIEALKKKIAELPDDTYDPDDEMNSNVSLMYSRTWI